MVDMLVSEASAEKCVGSSPTIRTSVIQYRGFESFFRRKLEWWSGKHDSEKFLKYWIIMP